MMGLRTKSRLKHRVKSDGKTLVIVGSQKFSGYRLGLWVNCLIVGLTIHDFSATMRVNQTAICPLSPSFLQDNHV